MAAIVGIDAGSLRLVLGSDTALSRHTGWSGGNRAALTTAYGAGLRVGEVARLTTGRVDRCRMLIRVQQGKGGVGRQMKVGLVATLRTGPPR